jgi:hypothetical protein
MNESNQKIVVVAIVALLVVAVVFGVLVLQRLERITQVAERTEGKLDCIIEVAAPVGRAVVEKGTEALSTMDAEALGKSASDGLKELGTAAKVRMLEHLEKKKQASSKQSKEVVSE